MKITKKIIAVLMAVIMLAVPFCSINAFAATLTVKRDCPNIEVHGFMAASILENKNDPNSKVIWPPDAKEILAGVGKALPKALGLMTKFDWDKFANVVADAAWNAMSPAFADKNGNISDNSGVYFVYPKAKEIKKNSEVKFRYDWRVDPLETAKKLNDYINYVLKCSGSKKVTIECHSFGGVVVLSYISLYGTSKLKGVCFNSTAIYGETYNGDLMRGKVQVNGEAIRNYLYYAFDSNEYEALLKGIVDLAMKAGLLNGASDLANKLVEKILDVAAKRVLIPMFGHWLSIWSMVPDEYLDEAMNYVFKKVYAGEDHKTLKNKIKKYNDVVRKNKTKTLKQVNKDCNVYVISRYGYSSLPLTQNHKMMSDGVVDTKYSSFGATTALYGETLSKKYLKNKKAQYISPDKSIDASTCLFPNQTWFIRNMKHSTSPDQFDNFIDALLANKNQATVSTYKAYPRFLVYDGKTEVISIDKGQKTDTSNGNLVQAVITTVKDKIKK